MSDEYTNTRTIMGDDAAFNALVAGTLENLVEDGNTSIGSSAIYNNSGIKTAKFPNATILDSNAINNCANLTMVDIGKQCNLRSSCLRNNAKLNSVILRGTTMSTFNSSNHFVGTPIALGKGGIFVPSDLVSTYKANSGWAAYNIYPISEYPRSTWDTISDTWTQILEAENDGTYSSKYSVGDTKVITINNADYYAQIVAFDADPLSDTSGNAKITWILKELYADSHRMNATSTNANGWPETEMRTWLNDTILPLIPSDVRSAIKEVTKTSYDKTTSADVTSNDKLWIPSAREVFTSSSYGYESSGPTYTTIFNSSSARTKYSGVSENRWWLRSASSGSTGYFQYVNIDGSSYSGYAYDARGVCLGFCT